VGKSRHIKLSLDVFLCKALDFEYILKQIVLYKKLKTEMFSTS